ncbi:MAG: peptide/nickel transport system ATP-binding protein ddpF [Gaiellales bacterium]|nr:peptide/nickel transport system ATP-binding protein ddpF [Gaiellales bacterium]
MAVSVSDLRVASLTHGVDIVADVSFEVAKGEALGVVGESGCGKTTMAMALLGYAKPGTRIAGGRVQLGDEDLLDARTRRLQQARGRSVSFVPQNPPKALSPGMRVGRQVAEMLAVHEFSEVDDHVRAAFASAQLPTDPAFLRRYPHQLSGGQQQRVAIAIAFACKPDLIVMDEPTTGLDVITQARLLEVIAELRGGDAAIVYVSHDLGVVRRLADRVIVMYGGSVVEEGTADEVFRNPRHPYTQRLLEAIPRVRGRAIRPVGIPGSAVEPWNRPHGCVFADRCDFVIEACRSERPALVGTQEGSLVRCSRLPYVDEYSRPKAVTLREARSEAPAASGDDARLVVRNLVAGYRGRGSWRGRVQTSLVAVDDVSFELAAGRCLAVVGESGSGKTTLARCIAGLHAPISGDVLLDGAPLGTTSRERTRDERRGVQMVFQDPDSSLNPSMSVGQIIGRPVRQFHGLRGRAEAARVAELLELVRLPAAFRTRAPRTLSGGEKQRVALARALAAVPRVLVCDEVTSALDVAVQASMLELLDELRTSLQMSMLFISHDLAVVRTISDSVLVLESGHVREANATEPVFTAPSAPYTRALLDAIPDLRPDDYPAETGVAGG